MAYTIHITQDAEGTGSSPPFPSEIALADLAAAIVADSAFSATLFAELAALPTADPLEDDAFWLNSGVVTKSVGAA